METIKIDRWLFSRLRPGDSILYETEDLEGKHEYFGKITERTRDLITINMYDRLVANEDSAVKTVYEIEDVIGQMYFVGKFEDLIRR